MRYSVYNYGTKQYDYYDDGKPAPTHAPAHKILSLGGVGAVPEAAAWRVPVGASKVGSGELPVGRIASSGFSGMGGISLSDPATLIAGGALAYFAWRIFK